MPCDQRITVVARLEKADRALLVKALKALGLDPYEIGTAIQFNGGRFQDGQLVLSGSIYRANDAAINRIKQAYGVEVVKQAASSWGWTFAPTESQVEGGQSFEVSQ